MLADEDAYVRQNRRLFLEGICGAAGGADVPTLVTVRQVHGTEVQLIGEEVGDLETETGRAVLEGDGMITSVSGVMLGIQVADCVPVLLADVRRRVVGAFHAGWRGTLAGIVEKGVGRMQVEFGTEAEDVIAAIGPSIGPCCYAVGEEVRSGFRDAFPYGSDLLRERGGETYLDLWEANRRQLIGAGVRAEAITVLGECSACARDDAGERRFFSHRAEAGKAGRMMGVIGVVA